MKKAIVIVTLALSATLTGCVVEPVDSSYYTPVVTTKHEQKRIKHQIRHERKRERKIVRKAARNGHLHRFY